MIVIITQLISGYVSEGEGGGSFLVSYKVSDVDRNQVNENKRELPAGLLLFSFNAYHVDLGRSSH